MDPAISEIVMEALTIDERGRLQKLLDLCALNITNNFEEHFVHNTSEFYEDNPDYAVMYSSSIRNITQYRAILKVSFFNVF